MERAGRADETLQGISREEESIRGRDGVNATQKFHGAYRARANDLQRLVMTELNLQDINALSPYHVILGGHVGMYRFVTDYGVEIGIGFLPDCLLQNSNSFEFVVSNLNNVKSPSDSKVKETILIIIEEFFNANQAALLYICETSDRRQAMRGRLFAYWFEGFADKSKYHLRTATLTDDEGIDNYAALIVRMDNPQVRNIIAEFDKAVVLFTLKPNS